MSRVGATVSKQVFRRIKIMLGRGATQRQAAKMLGVSRSVVARVALGDQVTRHPPRNDLAGGRDGFGLWPARADIQQPERCPTCGGRVYMPCRLCLLRKNMGEES